jgi:hypothetical protein
MGQRYTREEIEVQQRHFQIQRLAVLQQERNAREITQHERGYEYVTHFSGELSMYALEQRQLREQANNRRLYQQYSHFSERPTTGNAFNEPTRTSFQTYETGIRVPRTPPAQVRAPTAPTQTRPITPRPPTAPTPWVHPRLSGRPSPF